jgi:hypothetical protein
MDKKSWIQPFGCTHRVRSPLIAYCRLCDIGNIDGRVAVPQIQSFHFDQIDSKSAPKATDAGA